MMKKNKWMKRIVVLVIILGVWAGVFFLLKAWIFPLYEEPVGLG